MTEAQAAQCLIEFVPRRTQHIDKKVGVLATRMLLQIFSVPSLLSNLADFAIVVTGDGEGKVKLQFDFLRLPKEIIPELEKLLSTSYFKDHRLVKYVKHSQARTGLEIEVTPKDLPGEEYDYAY